MDLLHRQGQASAADIEAALPDAPSYSAVRAHLRHETEQLNYVYYPTVSPERARKSAMRHLMQTFFLGVFDRCSGSVAGSEIRSGPAGAID